MVRPRSFLLLVCVAWVVLCWGAAYTSAEEVAPAAASSALLEEGAQQQLQDNQHLLHDTHDWVTLNDDQYVESSSDVSSFSELGASSEVETELEIDMEGDLQQQQEELAEAETDSEALTESEAAIEEADPSLLDEETSMSVLVELSDHMDVSAILEHHHHQAMFKPKAKAGSAPKSASTPTASSGRGSAASRLTKDVQAAKFKSFTSKRNRKYKSPAEAATAFQTFSKNREAIVALNDKVAPNRPSVFKSNGPFADKAPGQFSRTRTNSRIPLDRARGKAVRIKRRSSQTGAGMTAGLSGQTAGQSGKTGGKSGKTAGNAGGKAKKSGKTGGDAGGSATKSGKTGGDAGGNAKKSGKTGGDAGGNAKKSGKTGGNAGGTGEKSGKTGGDAGGNGKKSGKTGGNSGTNAKKSGKTGGTDGSSASKSGKTGGNKGQNNALQPVLPPTDTKPTGKTLPTNIGVTVDSIRASMKSAGVSDADINAAFVQLKGEYKKGGDIGMDLFGYQKGDCGSCWAHAAGDALTRLWKKQRIWISNELISVQQILDCVHTKDSNGCNGGSPMDAIDYLSNNPIALLKEYPLAEKTGQCKAPPFGGRPNYKSAFGWEMSIPACTEKGDCKGQVAYEHLLLAWLKGNSLTPIVYVDASQWQHYSGGIFPLSACSSTTAKGNHIVQIVGYGTDSASGVPYWVIRNSWSRSWGEDGQIRIPFGVNACGLLNFVISVSDPGNSDVNENDIGTSDPIFGSKDTLSVRKFESGLTKAQILGRLAVKSTEKNQYTLDERTLSEQAHKDAKKFQTIKTEQATKDVAARRAQLGNNGLVAPGTAPVPKDSRRDVAAMKEMVATIRANNELARKIGGYVMSEAEIQAAAKDAIATRKQLQIEADRRRKAGGISD